MKLRYRESAREYLQELNPDRYQKLKETGELENYLNKMNAWAMNQHSKIRTDEMDALESQPNYPKDYMGKMQVLQQVEMQTQELVRNMLEEQVMKVQGDTPLPTSTTTKAPKSHVLKEMW